MTSLDKSSIKKEYLNETYGEIATILGIDATLKLHSLFKGQQVFFPIELLSKNYIRSQIIAEYDGKNIKQLVSKYGYTEKWIRKILKEGNDAQY